MRRWWWIAAVSTTLGCAEGGAGNGASGTAGAGGASHSTSSHGGAAGTTSTMGTSTATGTGGHEGGPGRAVINEIAAKGADWIEIGNPGGESFDLGDYGLCGDVDPTQGHECDMDTMVRFPKGTSLPPGGYLLILGDQDPAMGPGPHVMCLPDGGPTTCFYASFKVSSGNGETVHLIDEKDDPVDEVLYPMDAVPDGQTWGRVPDLTGGFEANDPTPGAANVAH